MKYLNPPNFGIDEADFYVMAHMNLKTGKATFQQAELFYTDRGIIAECRTYNL